jgi:hypothetical protein
MAEVTNIVQQLNEYFTSELNAAFERGKAAGVRDQQERMKSIYAVIEGVCFRHKAEFILNNLPATLENIFRAGKKLGENVGREVETAARAKKPDADVPKYVHAPASENPILRQIVDDGLLTADDACRVVGVDELIVSITRVVSTGCDTSVALKLLGQLSAEFVHLQSVLYRVARRHPRRMTHKMAQQLLAFAFATVYVHDGDASAVMSRVINGDMGMPKHFDWPDQDDDRSPAPDPDYRGDDPVEAAERNLGNRGIAT